MKTNQLSSKTREIDKKIEGAILPPLILWMLGVPGIIAIALWVFVFR